MSSLPFQFIDEKGSPLNGYRADLPDGQLAWATEGFDGNIEITIVELLFFTRSLKGGFNENISEER
jgi:hypothetical protein